VVALFNWSEKEATVGFDFAELGLDAAAEYAVDEFWTRTFQGARTGRFEMPVPGHGVRLLAVHRALPRPQFLSSDRHITQGAVELTQLAWDAPAKTLSGSVKAVAGHPLTLRFRVPAGFAFSEVRSAGDVSCAANAEGPEVLAVTLKSPASQTTPFTIAWK